MELRPSGSDSCTQELFPHLALSGQCIVDYQQCAVGSGPVVGLRRLHVPVDSYVVWWSGLFYAEHVAAVEELCDAASYHWGELCGELKLLCEAFYSHRCKHSNVYFKTQTIGKKSYFVVDITSQI